jgi:aryl-alcohol dehydrogenase-like predicted oxidoreductase
MGSTEQTPTMIYRNLGRSGLKVSVISLGGWVTYGGSVGDREYKVCNLHQALNQSRDCEGLHEGGF